MKTEFISFCCILSATFASAQITFRPLGDLPGGQVRSQAMAISGNGLVVVGSSSSEFSQQRDEAFRGTAEAGLEGLGALAHPFPPPYSIAFDVSHDGSVVVGRSGLVPFEAFRWSAREGLVGLGGLPGDPPAAQSIAWSTSADGAVVVGQSGTFSKAFRWTAAEGMVRLSGSPPGDFYYSSATDISADGNVIVGEIETISRQAFRWTAETGIVQLGFGRATAVSADGSVIVGSSTRAFRWTAESGMVSLGDLPGGRESSVAHDVSADGSIVVGQGETAFDGSRSTTEAFIWSAQGGMVNLRSFLVSQGLDLAGWTLTSAEGVSADGRTIVGTGVNPAGNPEGWVATIPEPSTIAFAASGAGALLWFYRRTRRRQTSAAVVNDKKPHEVVALILP
jgi:probable HAF family extracellular repeat protein